MMKRKLPQILLLLISSVLLSCSPTINQQLVNAGTADETLELKPRGLLLLVAPSVIYKGAIPCDDCPGIEVTLNLKDDNSVVNSQRYIQSKTKKTSKHTGSWVVII